jgi:hypothetical protein
LVTVEAIQSPGLAAELGGAGGAGAGGGALGAPSFERIEEGLAATPPLVELAAALGIFFFTIVKSGRNRKTVVAARAVVNKRRARTAKR